MNELFQVEVLSIERNKVLLKVMIVNPQQDTIYFQKNFALQLLWRYGDYNKKSKMPLYNDINEKKILDKNWVFSHDYKYILESQIGKTENYPLHKEIKMLPDTEWNAYWVARKNLPSAEILITVTKKDWIEHLCVGEKWLTRAVDYDFT